jgi:5'-3' exonuclease
MAQSNTQPALSFDLRRREIRRELFLQRQAERVNTENRLYLDGKKLDAQLLAEGYKLTYPSNWGRARYYKSNKSKA